MKPVPSECLAFCRSVLTATTATDVSETALEMMTVYFDICKDVCLLVYLRSSPVKRICAYKNIKWMQLDKLN